MLKRSLYLLLLLFVGTLPAGLSAQPADRTEALDKVLSHFAEHDKFMGSVAFFENGRVRYQFAYGMADVATEQLLNVETRFRIGSISKTVTAVLIFQLIEQGKLALDTPLARFFPTMPNAAEITIADLLYHRSGLASFTDQPDYTTYMTERKTPEELLALMAGLEPVFAPRERNEYSNTNYVLLGYIIEEVTGKPYGQVLKKQITQPLGLAHLYYGGAPNPLRNEAYSYRPGAAGWEKEPITDMSIPHGAGALVATPAALTRFMHALFSGELISESSLEQMTTLENGFGMGLFRFPFGDRYAYGHNGGIDGFVSNVAYFPEEEKAIAITVNALNGNLNDILIAALSTWFDVPYELPDFSERPIELTAEQLAAYAGTYTCPAAAESGGPAMLKLWVKEGQLWGGPTEANAIPLTPFSPTTFRFDPAGITLEFGAAEAGAYRSFTLQQGGKEFVYERQPDSER
jgi:D-alanyl-D-alanine carboxypeptidase